MEAKEMSRQLQDALARVTEAIAEESRHEVAADLRLLNTGLSFMATMLRGQDAVEKAASEANRSGTPPVEQPQQPAPTSPEQPATPGASLPPGPQTPQRRRQ